jgi:hypothetical protein
MDKMQENVGDLKSDLIQRLKLKGLRLSKPGSVSDRIFEPGDSRDVRPIKNSVVAIRGEKDW